MNPLTNMKNVIKLSEGELRGRNRTTWHDQYRGSAWIFVGGLPYDLTEGDIVCVFSQYGEPVNINLVRDKDSGKSKGFCFICYEDQRSTDLVVDNFNGIKILGRTIRVDHVENYKVPKIYKNDDEQTVLLKKEGLAGVAPTIKPTTPIEEPKMEQVKTEVVEKKVKKEKKSKKKKIVKKKSKKRKSSSSDSDSSEPKSKKQKKKRRKSTSSESSSSSSSSEEETPKKTKENQEKHSKTVKDLKREAQLIQEELERRQKVKQVERKKSPERRRMRSRSPERRRRSPPRFKNYSPRNKR